MLNKIHYRLSAILAVLLLTSLCFADARPELEFSDHQYGPNFYLSTSAVTPVQQGIWIPNGLLSAGFVWFEPLFKNAYGDSLKGHRASFLRFQTEAVLSPWYGMLQTMLGCHLIPRFEFVGVYQAIGYLNSNVEMAMAGGSLPKTLEETWTSDYFFDHLYDKSRWDGAQAIGLWMVLDLSFLSVKSFLEARYHFVDIKTDNENKNQDFIRGLPVHRRDFIMQYLFWTEVPISSSWSVDGMIEYQQTGWVRWKEYTKEAVQQVVAQVGPQYRFSSRAEMSVLVGSFWRPAKMIDASLAQRIFVRADWVYHWAPSM